MLFIGGSAPKEAQSNKGSTVRDRDTQIYNQGDRKKIDAQTARTKSPRLKPEIQI